VLCLILLVIPGRLWKSSSPERSASFDSTDTSIAAATRRYGDLPLSFEANHGQAEDGVRFLARGSGYTLSLGPASVLLTATATPELVSSAAVRLKMRLVGANPHPEISGVRALPGIVNYFAGKDPSRWHTGIPTFEAVRYEGVYPGIDQVYYGRGGQIEYDFIVAPGADPDVVRIRFDGGAPLYRDPQGHLILGTSDTRIQMQKPEIYQTVDGQRHEIPGEYVVFGPAEVGFRVGAFDRSLPLVIDPVLTYSTFLAASSGDAIAVDNSGNTYVTGSDATGNAFVARLNASGSALAYRTTLASGSAGVSIAVDGEGNAYVIGQTSLADFPTTANAFQAGLAGARDIYVVKVDPSGASLAFSTYLGGAGDDTAGDIAVDAAGNVYLTGTTNSDAFPTVAPFDATYGGDRDGFVARLNASGTALSYSTYLGGEGIDLGLGIAVDDDGSAYVTGQSRSSTFPTVNPIQTGNFLTTVSGDAFVSKFDPTGSQLAYSTFLGGRRADLGAAIAVDAGGNAYVGGWTASDDFPTRAPLQENLFGFTDAFVAKLNPAGSELVYSTYLGGAGPDTAAGIAVDAEGNVYLTGEASPDFPTVNPIEELNPSNAVNDAYLSKVNASGSELQFSTYFGGAGADDGLGIAVDGAQNVYVTGRTDSSDFPTASPLLGTLEGVRSAFVFRVDGPVPGTSFSVVDRGGTSVTSDGTSDSLTVGYARVAVDGTSSAPSGVAIFGLRQKGILVSEAGVPASPLRTIGRIYAEVDGAVNTGVAIANPSGQAASISFFFTGADGTNFGAGSLTLGANQQTARFLNEEPFNGVAPVNGSFTFIADVPVAVVALRGLTNERGEFLITTLPIADVGLTTTAPLFFSHFADGGGWTTQIALVNPSDATISGTLEFFDQSGGPVDVSVDGVTSSSFSYAVAPRTSQRFLTAGSRPAVRVGAAKVTPSAGVSPSGLAVFSLKNNLTTVSESGVPALPAGAAFRMYAEASGTFPDVGSIQTGVAVANPSSAATTLVFELSELNGTSSGLTGTASVPGQGQVALFLNQIQGFEALALPFQGVLRVSTAEASAVAVVGLRGRYNERSDFLITTTTPVNESDVPPSGELLFPHFVDGDGYTTQFIVFSGLAAQTTSGTLRFLNASGQTIPLSVQ